MRPIDIRKLVVRDAKVSDLRLSLDKDGNAILTRQPDNSAIGTAASRDTGTNPDEIPLNSDLGSAAYKATGTGSGDVPLNSDLGSASLSDTGTASNEVPLNSDLGSSSIVDTGTASNQIPLNSDLGSASKVDAGTGFDQIPLNADIAYPVANVAALRALTGITVGQSFYLEGHTDTGIGAGNLVCTKSFTSETDNDGTLFVVDGVVIERPDIGYITPEMFGSLKGSDNLAALNAATLAIGTAGNLQLEGDYEVSAPYSFEEKTGAKITCLGLVKILSTDKTQEVMRLSGRLVTSTGMLETGYAESVTLTIADTGAVGLLFTGLARSNMGGLRQKHVGVGHKIAQETGFGFPNGQNALFSNTFQYLDTSDFTYAAFDWRSFNGGSTGNAVLNWYMSNNVEGVASICDRFGWIGTFSDLTIGQWNFESAECRHLVTISSDVDAIDADTVHIENITPTNVNDGFFFLSNDVMLNIGVMALIGNKFNDTKAATYAVFRIADNTKVTVQGISERDATVTGAPNVRMVRYAGAGITEARVSVTNTNMTFVTNLEFATPQGMDPALFIPRIYPLSGVLIQTDASMTWGPQITERTVVFQGLTASRSFIINSLREYNGAACTIVNRDATFNVNISETDSGFTETLLPNTSVNIAFDGVDWGVV